MSGYYDGWTLIGLKNEFKYLVKELNEIKFSENR